MGYVEKHGESFCGQAYPSAYPCSGDASHLHPSSKPAKTHI